MNTLIFRVYFFITIYCFVHNVLAFEAAENLDAPAPKSNKVATYMVSDVVGHIASFDETNMVCLARVNSHYLNSMLNYAASQYAKDITENRYPISDVTDVLHMVPKNDTAKVAYFRCRISDYVKRSLAQGVLITRLMPPFLREIFEERPLGTERVESILRPLVESEQLDRSVLEHVRTRRFWAVKGGKAKPTNKQILGLAALYDVFDQHRLRGYQVTGYRGEKVKPFIIVSDQLRNDFEDRAEWSLVNNIFQNNPTSTLVIDYASQETADGLFRNYIGLMHGSALPLAVRNLSVIGDNVNKISNGFLAYSRVVSVDLSGLPNLVELGHSVFCDCSKLQQLSFPAVSSVRKVGANFCHGCSGLRFVDLSSLVNIESIGSRFFRLCRNLAQVSLEHSEEPSYAIIRAALQEADYSGAILCLN